MGFVHKLSELFIRGDDVGYERYPMLWVYNQGPMQFIFSRQPF